jgi:hypothetical protein
MNTDIVHIEFEKMIRTRGIAKKVNLTREHVRVLRNQLRKGTFISLDKKCKLLQRSGWRMDDREYTRTDLVSLAKEIIRASESARKLGPEYLVDKWLLKQ